MDLTGFLSRFEDELRPFGYAAEVIRLSTLLKRVEPSDGSWSLVEEPEGTRIDTYMTAGDQFRRGTTRNDALALMAASDIAGRRAMDKPVAKRTARILVSLKHPAEVLSLREIYDLGFFAIGLYTPEGERLRYLTEVRGVSTTEWEVPRSFFAASRIGLASRSESWQDGRALEEGRGAPEGSDAPGRVP